ncbi:uncharacterized protein LOC106156942 [Lingula anatina]|uniref:Uncharacterized protein LOC106156942 n=1 Tax=Lingula anatina TaxID=7574 RepID=A0A1S3HP87_LINAN|nr:uncharacterized protein LOC106156942 [Lingula anatina]|eukprot:XP_013387845.1 uncharacterized protein LOC106156942 [Lingula anatina]
MATEVDDIQEFLSNEYKTCSVCGGFYGTSFGQPVCSTCHLFLFPDDINNPEDISYLEKTDSGDSGNEEPDDATAFFQTDGSCAEAPAGAERPSRRGISTPAPTKPDKLAERIANLTMPREFDKEKIPEGLVDALPTEVLLVVFNYLDDISRWSAGNVCNRWQQIMEDETTDEEWQHFIRLRWPLFDPKYKVRCWRTIYTKLVESAPCRLCLNRMMLQSTPPIEENSWRHRRLRSELKTLQTDPPEGIQATPLDKYCCHWQASITGPAGSPYEGGIFYLYLQIPHR